MLLQEICVIKINPANITLKELTNFQGFLFQKQVHPIFILLEYCYFHLQKNDLIQFDSSSSVIRIFVFSVLLKLLIECTARLVGHYQLGQKDTVYLEMIYLGVQCMYFCAKPLQNQCILGLVHYTK